MEHGRHGIGIPGVEIHSEDHVCALFNGAARRDEILFSFLRAGLEDGDKCIMILDDEHPAESLRGLADERTLAEWRADGRLDVTGTAPIPPVGDELEVDQMLAQWDDAFAAAAPASRFDFVRVTGDATWWTPQTDEDSLVAYESALNRVIPERLAVLCLYDVARLGGSLLVDAVRAHPLLLVGSVVIENPYYVPPDELDALRRGPDAGTGPTDYEIYQLANIPRLDLGRPVLEYDCGSCGGALYSVLRLERDPARPVPPNTTTADPYPASRLTCPRCGAVWTHGIDGILTRQRPLDH